MTQPRELVAFAEAAVDQVEELFRSGLGALPAHFKGEGDFATEVDLQIEQQMRLHLTQLTGSLVQIGRRDMLCGRLR